MFKQRIAPATDQLARETRALGRNDAYLQQVLQQGPPRRLPEDVRYQLAALLEVKEQQLREDAATPPVVNTASDDRLAGYPSAPARLVHVPLLEVEVSAGGGGFDYVAEEAAAGWPFDRRRLGALYDGAPDDLRLVTVSGESLSPVLEDGDMVLVNTSDTQPSLPGTFVLFDGVGLMVKSLELLPGNSTAESLVRISSANTHYSAYQRRLVEIDIKGRIIWFGRRLSR